MFARVPRVDRRHELENLRRSLAMLTPGAGALTREQAIELIDELSDVQRRLEDLRDGLRQLIDTDAPA